MKHKFSFILLGASAGAAMMLLTIQSHTILANASARAAAEDTYRELNLFGEVFELVRDDYVDKPDDNKLIESAITGMLAGLDPHSSYMDPKNFKDMREETSGEFGGLRIEVTMEGGLVKVVAPIDETPAAKAGILASDLIVKVDDESLQGMTLDQVVDKLRGPANSKVKLTIMRKSQDHPIDVTLTREVIHVHSVRSKVEGDDIGYIRILQFTEQTNDGLRQAIAEITRKVRNDKLKGYILDLRNNPGGLLDEAISVTSAFIQRGEIVSTRGRNPEDIQRFTAKGGDLAKGKPLIVLINGGSASASEIVAGALQDQKRATIVGTRSFGKGSVQTIIPLGADGGALRLTTERYYTPSGRSIQAKGIEPDIEVLQDVPDDVETSGSIGEASLRGHLKGNAGKEQTGSQSYVPSDEKKDKALIMAEGLLRSTQMSSAFPPKVKNLPNQN